MFKFYTNYDLPVEMSPDKLMDFQFESLMSELVLLGLLGYNIQAIGQYHVWKYASINFVKSLKTMGGPLPLHLCFQIFPENMLYDL